MSYWSWAIGPIARVGDVHLYLYLFGDGHLAVCPRGGRTMSRPREEKEAHRQRKRSCGDGSHSPSPPPGRGNPDRASLYYPSHHPPAGHHQSRPPMPPPGQRGKVTPKPTAPSPLAHHTPIASSTALSTLFGRPPRPTTFCSATRCPPSHRATITTPAEATRRPSVGFATVLER